MLYLYTWLLKECVDELLPFITKIVNASIASGIFPNKFKEFIEKSNLACHFLGPVSNMAFISKVIKKVVSLRLDEHLYNYEYYV